MGKNKTVQRVKECWVVPILFRLVRGKELSDTGTVEQ